ncbi:MAG: zinc ribbon domain-containing protein [Verrucomicrobia bacterium]|jgi:putative FmdB family regulatory protein|nr:zinc ribbon domain-containing protein [Verrucomicrobiota bacterium]
MPTYEYVCKKCKAHLDIFHSMNDAPLKVCPKDKCAKKVWGKGKIEKQMGTGAGFLFKGSGFYITDYRSAGYKKAAKEATGGAEKSAEKKKSDGGGGAKGGEGKSGKST